MTKVDESWKFTISPGNISREVLNRRQIHNG